ncbi:hypothetical protein [Deinococcus ruber]|uniref:Phage portal protein n=1 Tax=Deinococcus ruber TaxID=1848197 RepID=A0A918BZN8_9DEIO|nr:hypothetical protein [Deinococcus ruber]GGR00227.1 hypothetical protein GCM10008957_11210 [Deinococcus ruber]
MTMTTDPTLPVASTIGSLPQLTYQLVLAFLTNRADTLTRRYDYAHENQFGANGIYWKGRKPAEGELTDVLPTLVMDDQIGPSMAREVDAQFAKDAEWDAIRDGNALDPGDEIVTALTAWHLHNDQLANAAKDVARQRFWAGRMVARVYIPDKYKEQLMTVAGQPKTLADALKLVRVKAVDPRQGGPLVDGHGDVLGYYYSYLVQITNQQPKRYIEVHTPEHVYLFLSNTGSDLQLVEEADNPFYALQRQDRGGDEYLMWHTNRDGGSALSESALMMQDRLNVVTTYMGRNDDQTGYRQFIVSNAEKPKDINGKDIPYQMGPAVVMRLIGTPYDDVAADASITLRRHDPKWEVVDPLNPTNFHIPSINQWKGQVLALLDQRWTIDTEGRSGVSGESKRQSRKPFERRVAFAAQDAGAFYSWALRAALTLAASLLGNPQQYQDITFRPKFYLDIDAANLEELKVKLLMWQGGALSLTALLEATPGVEDPKAEEERVKEGQANNPVNAARQDALNKLLGNANQSGG